MKEIALKTIKHYGVKHQQRKFQEEVFELNEAIFKYENTYYEPYTDYSMEERDVSEEEQKEYLKEHITEEIGDVMFMLKQFQVYYEITDEDIEKVMIFKGKRQLKRMEEENERIN